MSFKLDNILRCPLAGSPLQRDGNRYVSAGGRRYSMVHGVPVLLAPRKESTLWVTWPVRPEIVKNAA